MIKYVLQKFDNASQDVNFFEIFRGSAWALSSRILIACLGLTSHILIARLYGAEVMGIVAVVNSFLLIASIFTIFGSDSSILRFIPEHVVKFSYTSAHRIYQKTLFMILSVSIITGVFFFYHSTWMASNLFSKPQLSLYLYMASFFIVFNSLMIFNTYAVRGLRMIKLFVLMQLLPSLSNLTVLIILAVTLSSKDDPVYARLAAVFLTGVCGWLVMELAFRKRTRPGEMVQKVSIPRIFSISIPMFMTGAMGLIMGQIGVLMIGAFLPEANVGYYAIAVRLATLSSFVKGAINTIAAPKFSELFHSDQYSELFSVAKKSAKLTFWTTLPIIFVLLVFGSYILKYIFGMEFIASYPSMALLLAGQLIGSLAGSNAHFLNMTGNQKALGVILFGGALINVLLNWLLIPIHGMLGAAMASVGSTFLWNVSALLYIKALYGQTVGYWPFARLKPGQPETLD